MKQITTIIIMILIAMTTLTGCLETAATIADRNISVDAEEFKIMRKISFYNGITDKIMLTVEGKCSVEFYSDKFTVTCRTGENNFVKHYLGKSDNSFPIIEQLVGADVSTFHHKITYRPQALIPDIDVKVSGKALKEIF